MVQTLSPYFKIVLCAFLILPDCSSNTNFSKIELHGDGEIYYMWVPNNYSFYGLMVTIEKEKQFVYPDSATIYITTFENTPNANKIKLLGDSVYNFRFQNRELVKEINSLLDTVYEPVLPDTFELKGIDDAKMYWKDKKIGEVAIGYFNVSNAKLKLFESSLQTLELRKTSINKVEQ